MKKILITGGAGFIAGSLAERLIQNPDYFVVIVDNLLTGKLENLPQSGTNWKFIKADVNSYEDISAIMLSYSFDYVFHYAAVVGVQRTLTHPIMVLSDIEGIKNILSLAKNTGVQRVFYASSSEVYGESVSYPQDEYNTPLNSRLPYAVVKNIGEAFCTSYHKEFGLDYTTFRFFNTYGLKQSADFVISKFIQAAVNDAPITIHGDGSQSRTFCYIDDNIDTAVYAFENNVCVNDVINIGSEVETSILELAEIIIDLTNSQSKIVHLPPLEEGDMKRRLPDASKMRQLLNRPPVTLREGLQKVLELGHFKQTRVEGKL